MAVSSTPMAQPQLASIIDMMSAVRHLSFTTIDKIQVMISYDDVKSFGDYEREGPKVGVFENEEARGVALEEH